jgi:murein DD-endopeptidase MepM/ murein hydrolase activator NlpD
MPYKPKPIIFLREKIAEMMQQANSATRPVLGAAALLLLATVLTYSAVAGLQNGQERAAGSSASPARPAEIKAATEVRPPAQPTQPARQAIQQAALPPVVPAPKPQEIPKVETALQPEPAVPGEPRLPLKGETIISHGWQMRPVFKDWRFHNGIDMRGVEGEPVTAVWNGKVTEIYKDKTAGLTVVIASGEYTVYYGSLASAEARKGAAIKAGAKVGTVGMSQAEPYPHLHLAVKKGEKYIDPAEIL